MTSHPTDDLPGYALRALDTTERQSVEAHLAQCAACRAEVDSYRPVTEALARVAAVEAAPPAAMRDRLLGSAAAAPPALTIVRTANPRFRWAIAAAAVFALLSLGLGITNLVLLQRVNEQSAVLAAAQFNLLGPVSDLRSVAMTGDAAPDARGQLIGSDRAQFAYVSLARLPELPPTQAYQVWVLDRQGQRTSAGLLWRDVGGWGTMWIPTPEGLDNVAGVGITVEPSTGSEAPTGPRIVGVRLPN